MAVEADTIAKALSRLDALQGEVSARFKEEVTAAYDRAGKVSGYARPLLRPSKAFSHRDAKGPRLVRRKAEPRATAALAVEGEQRILVEQLVTIEVGKAACRNRRGKYGE